MNSEEKTENQTGDWKPKRVVDSLQFVFNIEKPERSENTMKSEKQSKCVNIGQGTCYVQTLQCSKFFV